MYNSVPNKSNVHNSESWLKDPNHYPMYEKVFKALQPQYVFEIGTFLGYGLCAAVAGSEKLNKIGWYDPETCLKGSNLKALENIQWFCKELNKEVSITYFNEYPIPKYMENPDIVHIDGMHLADYVYNDIFYSFGVLNTPFVIGHDLNYSGGTVKEGVEKFCVDYNLQYNEVKDFTNGLYIIGKTPKVHYEAIDKLSKEVVII